MRLLTNHLWLSSAGTIFSFPHYPFIKYSLSLHYLLAKAQSVHSNSHKHYLLPRLCITLIINKKSLPRWHRIMFKHTRWLASKFVWELPPSTSCSQWKYNVKLHLKPLAQLQCMQMTDRHLLTTIKASSPALSGTRASGISTTGLPSNAVFPKGLSSLSMMTPTTELLSSNDWGQTFWETPKQM